MNKWPYEVKTYSPEEVQDYCVHDAAWQKVRLSMKGISTKEKLVILEEYLKKHLIDKSDYLDMMSYIVLPKRIQVQIDNYINALKRGGQLNMQLEVAK